MAAVLGIRMLSQGPSHSTDVLVRDGFAADDSGWYRDAGTRVDTSRGYTGDGRHQDEEAGGATGKPRFGLSVAKRSGASEETRAYFDDFEIDRLS
ncbi:hypothetical protein ACFQX6_61975 [Streptosporangium lutulentum]